MAKQFNFKPSKNPVLPPDVPTVSPSEDRENTGGPIAAPSAVSFAHLLCLTVAALVFSFSLLQNTIRGWVGLERMHQPGVSESAKDDVKGRIHEAVTGKKSVPPPVFQMPTDWVGKVCFYGGLLVILWSALQWFGGTNFWFPLIAASLGAGAIALQIAWVPLLLALAKNGYQKRSYLRRTRRN